MNKKIKKLTLNTETLRSLTEENLEQVAGAATARCTNLDCTATRVCSGCAPCA
jgi:hypothetical protein